MISKFLYFDFLWGCLVSLLFLGAGWMWLQQTYQLPAVTILAPRSDTAKLPVYAQFVVTQTIKIPKITRLNALSLPLNVPSSQGSLHVRLQQNNKIIEAWGYSLTDLTLKNGELFLPFPESRLVEGDLEVTIAAPDSDAHFPENAPQLFFEGQDMAYPFGNARIAENNKNGDIALTLFEQRSQLEVWLEQWHSTALRQISYIVLIFFSALFFTMIPTVVKRIVQNPTTTVNREGVE